MQPATLELPGCGFAWMTGWMDRWMMGQMDEMMLHVATSFTICNVMLLTT